LHPLAKCLKLAHMGANEKHKDSIFSRLFSDPDTLRELYSAIEGVELPPDTAIDINTLSNALFMGQINDVSFTVGGRLVVLIEHQSTINENMPLRMLMYIGRVYEKIIDRMKLYQTKLEQIPAPIFIVLYNGKAPFPAHKVLRLSDAFKNADGLRAENPDGPALELVVHVYNINQGYNAELMGKCETLKGYSVLVSKIWECRETMELEAAMEAAVRYCIDNDILRLFLKANSSEVLNMLITEWNLEEAQRAWLAQGRAEGKVEGKAEGKAEGKVEGKAEGIEIGVGKGKKERDKEVLDFIAKGYTLEDIQKELSSTVRM